MDAVLLDDDDLILRSWALAAKKANVRLAAFRDSASFRECLATLPKKVPLYIDSKLAGGEKGELVAKEASELGFTRIYLATGMPPDAFTHCIWLSGVVGKDPPWPQS